MQMHSILFATVFTAAFATPFGRPAFPSRDTRSPFGSFRSFRGPVGNFGPSQWGSNRNGDFRQWDRRSYNYDNSNNNDGGRYWNGFSNSAGFPMNGMSGYPSFSPGFSRNSGMGSFSGDSMFRNPDRGRNSGFGIGDFPDFSRGFNSGYPMGSTRNAGMGFNSGFPMGNGGIPGVEFSREFQLEFSRENSRGINSGFEMGGFRDNGLGLNSGFDMRGGQPGFGMRNSGLGFDRFDSRSPSFNSQTTGGFPRSPDFRGGSNSGRTFGESPQRRRDEPGGTAGFQGPGGFSAMAGPSNPMTGGRRQRGQSSRFMGSVQ